MSDDTVKFKTSNTATSYTSAVVTTSMRGYRTGVLQANAYTGDTILLQGRMSAEAPWVDILEVSDQPTIVEVVLCRELRVVVTNASTQNTTAFISR